MIAVQPRQFVHRGSVLASGFLLRWELTGIREARRRVLPLLGGGAQVKTTGDAFIVLLPGPLRVIAEESVGEPLVRNHRMLTALPLDAEEIKQLDMLQDSVVFARAGEIQIIELTACKDEDVSAWIDTSDAVVAEVVSLGPAPQPPQFIPVKFDAREDLPGVPPAAPELKQLLQEIRQLKDSPARESRWNWRAAWTSTRALFDSLRQRMRAGGRDRSSSNSPARREAAGGTRAPGKAAAGFASFLQRLRQIFLGRKQRVQTGNATQQTTAQKKNNRAALWLNQAVARMLSMTGLARLTAGRQARYVMRMMQMLQSGDVHEGLRHAIPLSAVHELEAKPRLLFGILRPRAALRINPNRPSPAYSIGMGLDIFNYLRDLYRQTFQRLDAQGRIEEAAFVLVELLAQYAEAVSYLEKHGRLRPAAEIAEAKALDPAIAIRLWWLAGESQRAITLACRTNEFEAAIRLLSAQHPEEAADLRCVWAQRLADEGKFTAAAEALWPVTSGRWLADHWLSLAIELGGTSGAVAVARKMARFPQSFTEALPAAETLLADESAEQVPVRLALIDALLNEENSAESQILARMATRALVAHDTGTRSISDIAVLPDGRLLLALGEAGMLLLSRTGKALTFFNQPAHKLVASDDGSRVIGIAQRGSVCRLTRVDVPVRSAAYWCDATITAWNNRFDGSLWMVAHDRDVFLIDTLAKGFDAVWRIPDMDGTVRAVQRTSHRKFLYVVTETPEELALWTYESPRCVLRSKQMFTASQAPLPQSSGAPVLLGREAVLITEEGIVFEKARFLTEARPRMVEEERLAFYPAQGRNVLDGDILSGNFSAAATSNARIAVPVFKPDYVDVLVLNTDTGTDKCRVRLHGTKSVALRLVGKNLLCGDDLGRVLMLDLNTGAVLRDFRV
ncbi:MAG: hypothetical protein DMG65_26270 [Candidatus Angelobacter sp. Gp1-AA117]|nr:MAG: hypothetical protein DMG65_26270 [Candidatus Angelobacter sp. Gp1-AA117]